MDAKALIEALEMDTDTIKEQIVEAAASRLVKSFDHEARQEIKRVASLAIGKRINMMVDEVLSGPYQPIDTYGRPTGELTTLRIRFQNACEDWWKQSVDEKGNPTTSRYKSKPRHVWAAEQAIGKVIDYKLQKEIAALVRQTKEKAKEGMAAALKEQLDKIWR